MDPPARKPWTPLFTFLARHRFLKTARDQPRRGGCPIFDATGVATARSRSTGLRRCLIAIPRWRRDKAAQCTDRPTNRGAESGAVSSSCGGSNCSPATGSDQATPDRSLNGSYGLVQAERPKRSPITAMQRVIRSFDISQPPTTTISPPGHTVATNNNSVRRCRNWKMSVETAFTGLHIRGRTYCPGATIALISGECRINRSATIDGALHGGGTCDELLPEL